MSWATIRARARRVVHRTFAREATYTAPGAGSTPTPARIRLHTKIARYGDLERDGYAEIIDDVNQVLVDIGELTPERNGTIDFGGIVVSIDEVIPEKMEEFWICNVSPVNP